MSEATASPAEVLKAPFPAFGGKSRIAGEVWARLGVGAEAPRNYVEPFCFSAAMLLRRPEAGAIETINDRNAFVSNFWRAVQRDPEAVAAAADWPVNEVDLHARHRWLVASVEAQARLERVRQEPEYFDATIAGWWCWGACCWIGSGWCDESHRNSASATRPDLEGQMVTAGNQVLGGSGQGVTSTGIKASLPHMGGSGSPRSPLKLPHLDAAEHAKRPSLCTGNGSHGPGVRAAIDDTHRPQLTDEFSRGWGVNGGMEIMPCARRRAWVTAWMLRLADRLRSVRVCCGHWDRICDSPSTMTRLGVTAAFLDPPYRVTLACGKKNRSAHIYANDRHQDVNALCDEVQAWCLKWAGDPMVRIALCGLEGEYPAIEREGSGWTTLAWKSNGGYGNRRGGKENKNAARERVWFSPHCVRPCSGEEGGLFA